MFENKQLTRGHLMSQETIKSSRQCEYTHVHISLSRLCVCVEVKQSKYKNLALKTQAKMLP